MMTIGTKNLGGNAISYPTHRGERMYTIHKKDNSVLYCQPTANDLKLLTDAMSGGSIAVCSFGLVNCREVYAVVKVIEDTSEKVHDPNPTYEELAEQAYAAWHEEHYVRMEADDDDDE